MALSRMLAAAALIAALAVPATAGAAGRMPDGQRTAARDAVPRAKAPTPLDAAAAVGRRFWGAVPCQGKITILARQPPAPGIDPDSDAWVTFESALGANNLAAPASSYTDCVIAFARRRWPTTASMQADWAMLCTTMTHELGHLLGHPHDDTPLSVMAPVFTDRSSVPAVCRAARPGRSARSDRHHR